MAGWHQWAVWAVWAVAVLTGCQCAGLSEDNTLASSMCRSFSWFAAAASRSCHATTAVVAGAAAVPADRLPGGPASVNLLHRMLRCASSATIAELVHGFVPCSYRLDAGQQFAGRSTTYWRTCLATACPPQWPNTCGFSIPPAASRCCLLLTCLQPETAMPAASTSMWPLPAPAWGPGLESAANYDFLELLTELAVPPASSWPATLAALQQERPGDPRCGTLPDTDKCAAAIAPLNPPSH